MSDYLMPGIPRNIAENPDMETVELIRASITEDSCQVVDSDMLLPCPFCGGTRVHIAGAGSIGVPGVSWVFCDGCFSQCGICDTVEEAVELWNNRSERTCHIVRGEVTINDYFNGARCSECGHEFETFTNPPNNDPIMSAVRYCPHCGAKVDE